MIAEIKPNSYTKNDKNYAINQFWTELEPMAGTVMK